MVDNSLILIVDDNPSNRKMLEIILNKSGYDTISLEDGKETIKKTAEIQPDLILLDVMMPGTDGFEVCEQLKSAKETKDIPVIFLTAKSEVESLSKGFEVGASDYLKKPYNQVELLARVKTHISLRKSFKDLEESQNRILELEKKNTILAMAGTANHEINQPLTVISGNLYLLEESFSKKRKNKDQSKYFKEIEKAVQKIKEILERYRNAVELRYKDYAGTSKIIILDDETSLKKKNSAKK